MKLTQIDNACCIYESQGFKLLCDPWLTDGAFEGSWFHYPPLVTTFDYIKNVDAIYISHLHPDHYDEKILSQFVAVKRDIPVLVLDHGHNFLFKKLDGLGFTNLIKVKDKETITLGPLEVTLYAPFVSHPFDNSDLGNFLDSALVVESNGKTILNANDNTPTVETAKLLKSRHGKFTVAQLKDSLAGPYPSCFIALSNDDKISEASRLIKRQLLTMCQVAKELEAEWFQPFAGDYQLGGKLADKNKYLGVTGKKFSAGFISKEGLKPLILNEQGSIDLVTGELKASYRKDIPEYGEWLTKVSKIPFTYELDTEPDYQKLKESVIIAFNNLSKFQNRFNYYPELIVNVNGFEKYLGKKEINSSFLKEINYIGFRMNNKLLRRILDKISHFNNAEVGCHIEIERMPNIYDHDLVNAMSFFHT